MHISEGILSPEVLAAGWILTAAGTAVGLRKTGHENIMAVAVLTSAFFVISLLHIPIGPSNAHLLLPALMGIILGWTAFPAILSALFLQAVFFQFGGLTTLGINCADMAIPALASFYICHPFIRKQGTKRNIVAFASGAGAVLMASLMTAAALALSGDAFAAAARLLVISHVPVMIIEGFITMTAVNFLARVEPEILEHGSH
jgi:cobalt/nickel transport system permease protein